MAKDERRYVSICCDWNSVGVAIPKFPGSAYYLPFFLEPTRSIASPRGSGRGKGIGLAGLAIMAMDNV